MEDVELISSADDVDLVCAFEIFHTIFTDRIFLKKIQTDQEVSNWDDDESDEEVDRQGTDMTGIHDGVTFQLEQGDTSNIRLSSDIEIAVKKIRDTVKMFKASPVSNDHLQKKIQDDPKHKKKKQLLLDVRTRWGWF